MQRQRLRTFAKSLTKMASLYRDLTELVFVHQPRNYQTLTIEQVWHHLSFDHFVVQLKRG